MAQDNSNYYGKLDEQTLIFKHLDRLSCLSTEIEDLYEENLRTYAHRFQMGVHFLESLINPLIDEEYSKFKEEEKEKINRERIDKKDYEKRIKLKQKMLDKLIELLYKNNIYWGEQENIVVDETKENEEEAYTLD